MPRFFTFDPAGGRPAAEMTAFGTNFLDVDYGDLIGDISGDAHGRVTFNEQYASHQKTYAVTIRAQTCLFSTVVRINPQDFQYCDMKVHSPGHGIARLVFLLLATTAQRLNFTTIHAAGSKFVSANNPAHNAWGYYVYPKYGFDAAIPAQVVQHLSPQFRAFTRVQQLMAIPQGKAEWKQHGVQINDMTFDLTAGSPAWGILRTID